MKQPKKVFSDQLAVIPKHSTVLGYKAWTKDGAALWKTLDWSWWYVDGGNKKPHMLDAGGGKYLHVKVKHDRYQDGPCKDDYRVFRVRCRWSPGDKYKRRTVKSVGVGFFDCLCWIVAYD